MMMTRASIWFASRSTVERATPAQPVPRIGCCDQGCSSISPGRHVLLNHGPSGP